MQVLDPVLDLRTVKHSIWRSGGDMKLFYRERKGESALITPQGDDTPPSPKLDSTTKDEESHEPLPLATSAAPPSSETETMSV